jgi:hypothetical protein
MEDVVGSLRQGPWSGRRGAQGQSGTSYKRRSAGDDKTWRR